MKSQKQSENTNTNKKNKKKQTKIDKIKYGICDDVTKQWIPVQISDAISVSHVIYPSSDIISMCLVFVFVPMPYCALQSVQFVHSDSHVEPCVVFFF